MLFWWLDGARKLYTRASSWDTWHAGHVRVCMYTRPSRVDSGNCTPGTTPARARIPTNIDPQSPVIPSRTVEWKFNFRAFSAGTSFSDRSLDSQEIVRHKTLVFATWCWPIYPSLASSSFKSARVHAEKFTRGICVSVMVNPIGWIRDTQRH